MSKRRRRKKELFLDLAAEYRGSATPICEYFGKCGGCLFQDVDYKSQLKIKEKYLKTLFEGICDIPEVIGAEPYAYRNRMDFVTAFGKKGLRERGSFKFVVDIEKCPLMQSGSNRLWKKIREEIKDVIDYDYLEHTGYLRYVVLREAFFTGQVMCNFVIAKNDNFLEKAVKNLADKADSISFLLSDGLADLSFGPVVKNHKQAFIEEKFDNLKYRIYPNSFFQSNSQVAIHMYKKIKEYCRGNVLDLYSGVGSISLYIADNVKSVTGIEIVEEAVNSANENLKLNEIANVKFICSDARVYMRENANKYDTLVMDPPRSGIHPKMIKHIDSLAAPRIIYMSCNPATFKDNLLMLENYKLTSFEAYDMFPQTPHLESLAILERK